MTSRRTRELASPFADVLAPGLAEEIAGWEDAELRKLRANLEGHDDRRSFLDTFAEVLVARHLLERSCPFRVEVPNPGGRTCDFLLDLEGRPVCLHVKRLDTERSERLTISARLRALEQIERPLLVGVRWDSSATTSDQQRIVEEAEAFIRQARVGEELRVAGRGGAEIGRVAVIAPSEGSRVTLVIGLPRGAKDPVTRMRKLLRRAYRQFMPRAENVVLLCSSRDEDRRDFETALLGAHVERWDEFPPRDRRVAHGRAEDGLWHGTRYVESRIAGWFAVREDMVDIKIWAFFRDEGRVPEGLRGAIAGVLE